MRSPVRGRARCARPHAPTATTTLAIAAAADRSLLLAAVGGLLLELVDDPRGPSPRRIDEACDVAAQLTQDAELVHVPLGISEGLGRHIDERQAVMRP